MENEKENAEKRTNIIAAIGMGFVCLVIGLPLWWKTTEVYRVSLPYSDIDALAEQKIEYSTAINVISFVDSLTETDLIAISKHLIKELEGDPSSDVQPYYKISIREARGDERQNFSRSSSASDFEKSISGVANQYSMIVLPKDNPLSVSQTTLGVNRCVFFVCEDNDIENLAHTIVTTVKTSLIREATVLKGYNTARGERNIQPDKETMRSVRSHPGYDITITLVSPRPDITDVQWDIEKAVEAYLNPFLSKLEDYAKINLKSQVLYFTKLQSKPRKDKDAFYFTMSDLPLMVNPLESKLGSPASTQPDLNFLVYVPTKEQYPLYIKGDEGNYISSNSFMSPQWGGVLIYNVLPPSQNDTLPIRPHLEMKHVMEVFISQIRLLLNLHSQVGDNVQILPTGNLAITEWELDSWLRSRCVENIAVSSASLKSLAQLLDKISNIVINDDIGLQVHLSVESMKSSYQLLQDGNLVEAFIQSRTAAVAAEKAFFDPSLLELLYFPEDQKFAIYIPLFLPISFPVLASLWQAYRWYKKQDKPKQE